MGTLRQRATIVAVTASELEVEVCRPDACGSCRAKVMCGGEGGGKQMTLANDEQGYEVGEEITLVIQRGTGLKAILIAYLVPVFLLIGTLLIGQYLQISEIQTGIIALGILALYFIILGLLRSRMNREMTIEIEKEIQLPE